MPSHWVSAGRTQWTCSCWLLCPFSCYLIWHCNNNKNTCFLYCLICKNVLPVYICCKCNYTCNSYHYKFRTTQLKMKEVLGKIKHLVCKRSYSYPIFTVMNSGYKKIVVKESKTLKDEFQSVLLSVCLVIW